MNSKAFSLTPHVKKSVLTLYLFVKRQRIANKTVLILKVVALYPPGPGFPRALSELARSSTINAASDPWMSNKSEEISLSFSEMHCDFLFDTDCWPKCPSDP